MKKKLLLINTEEISQMEKSVYSQIGRDGLRFLKYDLQVGPKGLTTIQGGELKMLFATSKQVLTSHNIELGRGSACTVQQGTYEPLGIKVAIKTINIHDRDKRHQMMNDIRILLSNLIKEEHNGYKCQFIVTLYGAYYDDGAVKVILQLMDGGSLADIINVYKKAQIDPNIDERILAKVAVQILCGLAYLHTNQHLHRDIKPGNILINTKGQVKISDFGISRQFIDKQEFSKTFVGTRAYMSPERIQGQQYSYQSDIWSFGLVIYQLGTKFKYLATAIFPYKHKSYIELRQQFINKGTPELPQPYSQDFRDFIKLTLIIDPKKRGTALKLLGHRWLLKNLSSKVNIKSWLIDIKENVIPIIQGK